MRRSAVLASALLACSLLGLRAQSPQQPAPPFRAGIDVVQMDVSVLDRDRRPVKGLTATDFTIVEDGNPRPIVAFEAIDLPDVETATASWVRDAAVDVVDNERAAKRFVLIVIDDIFIPLDKTNEVKRIARDVVDRLGAEDLAVVTFTGQGQRQDVTTDRERLRKAIDSFVPHISSPKMGSSLQCAYRGRFRSAASCVLDTLVTASQALINAPQGRKTLVYISAGFEYTTDTRTLTVRGDATPTMPDHVAMAENAMAIETTLKNLQRANVNVYAIDPSGVDGEGIMSPKKDWLRMFSEDTGGRATMFTNTPWEAVPQIFRENSSYYLLGFRPTNTAADGAFRKVQIKVKGRDLEVRARPGYTAPSEVATVKTAPATPLEKGIQQSMSGGDLAMASTLAPFWIPDHKNAALAVVTLLRAPLLEGVQTIEIATRALDADCGECKKLPSSQQVVTFSPRPGQAARAEVLSRLELPPGNYEIRVAATLAGRAGSVINHIEVPDFRKEKLTASGLVLSASGAVATAERSLMADLLPAVPTAAREFTRATTATAFLRLYQIGSKTPVDVQVTTTILDAAGKTNREETATFDAAQFSKDRSAGYRWALPLAELDPGPHLLAINVQAGTLSVKREARFWVK